MCGGGGGGVEGATSELASEWRLGTIRKWPLRGGEFAASSLQLQAENLLQLAANSPSSGAFSGQSPENFADLPQLPFSFILVFSWKARRIRTLTRRQFAINVAYALTIHKAQGLTLDKAIVDIGAKEAAAGLTYVALSRVRRLEDLILS